MMTKTFIGRFTALHLLLVCLIALSISINTTQSQEVATPIPTPENPDLVDKLQSLLSDEDCIFPCWLGWILGKDHLSNAQILMSRNFQRGITPTQDLPYEQGYWRIGVAFDAGYPYLDEYGLPVSSGFTKIHLFVSRESNLIHAGGLVAEQPRWSYVDWSAYRLESILTHYGTPDEVTITYPINGSDEAYFLGVRYFDLGIYTHYFMGFKKMNAFGTRNTTGIPICNHVNKMVVLKVWYQSEALPELELASEWDTVRYTQDYERPLDTVSDLTLAEFTELMSQPDTCFTTLPPAEWEPPFNG